MIAADGGASPRAALPGALGARVRLTGGKSVIEVTLGENDRLDWALKQFRRKLIRSGLLKEIKKKRFYEKPSEARKRKQAAARRRSGRARRAAQRAT